MMSKQLSNESRVHRSNALFIAHQRGFGWTKKITVLIRWVEFWIKTQKKNKIKQLSSKRRYSWSQFKSMPTTAGWTSSCVSDGVDYCYRLRHTIIFLSTTIATAMKMKTLAILYVTEKWIARLCAALTSDKLIYIVNCLWLNMKLTIEISEEKKKLNLTLTCSMFIWCGIVSSTIQVGSS